jgi:hypothetical protein
MRIWISIWRSRQRPVTGIFVHKTKFSVFYKANNRFYQIACPSQTVLLPMGVVRKPFRILFRISLC